MSVYWFLRKGGVRRMDRLVLRRVTDRVTDEYLASVRVCDEPDWAAVKKLCGPSEFAQAKTSWATKAGEAENRRRDANGERVVEHAEALLQAIRDNINSPHGDRNLLADAHKQLRLAAELLEQAEAQLEYDQTPELRGLLDRAAASPTVRKRRKTE
jgi:hypothetical protein